MIEIKSHSFVDSLGHAGMVCECYDTETKEKAVRRLSMEDYLDFLGSKTKPLEHMHKIPQLPENYYAGSIGEQDSFKVLLYEPPKKRPVFFITGHYEVPFPALLFYFHGKNGQMVAKQVYALKEDVIPTSNTLLYHYPFGNVSELSSICFGNIQLPKIGLNNSHELVDLFFLGKTNNDYFVPGNKVTVHYSQQKLLEQLSKKEKFPSRWLKPAGGNVNVLLEKLEVFN